MNDVEFLEICIVGALPISAVEHVTLEAGAYVPEAAVVELLPFIVSWLVPFDLGLTNIFDEIPILTDFAPIALECVTVIEGGLGAAVKVFTLPSVELEIDADVLPVAEALSAAVTVIVLEAVVYQSLLPK